MPETIEPPKVSRRLAAILAADIAGYSALMGADEARTVRDLKAHQAVVIPMIAEHGGRIIDTAGDGILAEFGSAVNAIECAVVIQKIMTQRNAGIEDARRMQYRIGINVGDIIHDEHRVYGDGVNIAARLEAIAEPGGICISREAFAQVQRKLPLSFTDVGEQHLKNIGQSVRVYRVNLTGTEIATRPLLSLPDKPSIAVLPFTNLSGDSSQDYFSAGITEDIITELSRFTELFVIAWNSSFTFKGKAIDVRQVGRELGVRYVVQGSIRRTADRVRISAQLIDALSGGHCWAERYDREIQDIFAAQDEVVRTIVAVLAAQVNKTEAERTLLKPPANWQAYDYYLRAASAFNSFWSSLQARDLHDISALLEHGLQIDPHYGRAYALLSGIHLTAWINALDDDYLNPFALDRAHELALKAVHLEPNLPQGHAQLGSVLVHKREHEASIAEFERASALNPNFTDWYTAAVLVYAGEPARAIDIGKSHMRLDPLYPAVAPAFLGFAYHMLKEYSAAVPLLRECVSRAPNLRGGHVWLAATYARLGQVESARKEAAEVLRIQPAYTINGSQKHLSAFKARADAEHLFDGLRMAGLPED